MLAAKALHRVRHVPPRLMVIIACANLAVTLLVAFLVDARVSDLVLDHGGTRATRATDHMTSSIQRTLTLADFEPPHTQARLENFPALLDPLLSRAREWNAGILRVNVVAHDGTILYSDLPTLRGQAVSPRLDPALASALDGTGSTKLDDLSSLEDADLKARYSQAVRTYVPLVLDGRVVGAYDVYQVAPFPPLRLMARGLIAALLCLAVLLLVLLALVWPRLSRQYAAFQAGVEPMPSMPSPGGTVAETWGGGDDAGCAPILEQFASASPSDENVRLAAAADRATANLPMAGASLTSRQIEILRLMATNATYREIAAHLVVDEETVRSHVKRIRQRLGQPDRTQTVLAAVRAGLVELG